MNERTFFSVRLQTAEEIRRECPVELNSPDPIDQHTERPARNGPCCEILFGRDGDWECTCGRLRGVENVGYGCLRCDSPVVHLRSTRWGRIEFPCPMVNPLFMDHLAAILNYTADAFDSLVHFQFLAVIDPGPSPYKIGDLIHWDNLSSEISTHGPALKLMSGAEAARELLSKISLFSLRHRLRRQRATVRRHPDRHAPSHVLHLRTRLRVVEELCATAPLDPDGYAQRMFLDCLPVLPPAHRLLPEEGGAFRAGRLTWAYAQIINRNNRLRKLLELHAPEVIVHNEQRMLQQSINVLFDAHIYATRYELHPAYCTWGSLGGRLCTLTRRRLRTRRVDYSASSVLVVDADLHPDTCAIPQSIATELFRTHLLARLATGEYERQLLELLRPRPRGGLDESYRAALRLYRELLQKLGDLLQPLLEETLEKNHLVLSLHRDRPGPILALRPILVSHEAVAIHPETMKLLEATPGRLIHLHLPLSDRAQEEAKGLLSPKALHQSKRDDNTTSARQLDSPPFVNGVSWFQNAQKTRQQLWQSQQDARAQRQKLRRQRYGNGLLGRLVLDNPIHALADYAISGEREEADSFLGRWLRAAYVEEETETNPD